MAVTPLSKLNTVFTAKDLKPSISSDWRYIGRNSGFL
jgi:hypothetical protein